MQPCKRLVVGQAISVAGLPRRCGAGDLGRLPAAPKRVSYVAQPVRARALSFQKGATQ
jgi:hypothetical protein